MGLLEVEEESVRCDILVVYTIETVTHIQCTTIGECDTVGGQKMSRLYICYTQLKKVKKENEGRRQRYVDFYGRCPQIELTQLGPSP